jgi:hypothetical protein
MDPTCIPSGYSTCSNDNAFKVHVGLCNLKRRYGQLTGNRYCRAKPEDQCINPKYVFDTFFIAVGLLLTLQIGGGHRNPVNTTRHCIIKEFV